MRPRPKPLTTPDSDRYWAVELPGKGSLSFRHPYFGVGAALMVLMGAQGVSQGEDKRPLQEQAISLLPIAGAVIGACWHHPTMELENQIDLGHLDPDALVSYSHAVCEELQDAGYDLLDIIDLFGSCATEIMARQSILEMAKRRLDFSGAPDEEE